MRSLLLAPPLRADDVVVEAADLAEVTALFQADGNVSREDLARALHRRSGATEEHARRVAEDAFNELSDRLESCGAGKSELNRYPFSLSFGSTLLSLRRPFRLNSNFGLLYWFLLFVTRADMSASARTLDHTDPTTVFERLCAEVLCEFWGGVSEYSGAMVVGTASARGKADFKEKIVELCQKIGEGNGWRLGAVSPGAGDAKLDLAAWKRFADKRQGGLLGFAQCKTGIHWKDHLTKLRPETFCRRFFQQIPTVLPMRLYMVPNRIVSQRWEEHSLDGGLLMDRCRILQYGSSISPATLRQCKRWVHAAYRRQKSRRVTI
ncbi:MAG TPA: hypothetical protein VN952_00395 [Chthoniobacterales bacterium]|nr:hypothetical protein [Chthoniobacterales bacterium]